MKFEKCNFVEATHIMLADGVTVRDITRIEYGCFKIANDTANQRELDARLFGATFVREIDDTPEPWESTFKVGCGHRLSNGNLVAHMPEQFYGHQVQMRVEVIK